MSTSNVWSSGTPAEGSRGHYLEILISSSAVFNKAVSAIDGCLALNGRSLDVLVATWFENTANFTDSIWWWTLFLFFKLQSAISLHSLRLHLHLMPVPFYIMCAWTLETCWSQMQVWHSSALSHDLHWWPKCHSKDAVYTHNLLLVYKVLKKNIALVNFLIISFLVVHQCWFLEIAKVYITNIFF